MGQLAEPITVIFVCAACGDCYEATQGHAIGKGIFRCKSCRKIIHQWDGVYDYTEWRRFDPTI